MRRLASLSLMAVALLVFVVQARAADAPKNAHDGKVVSVTGNKIVMSDLDGKNEHTMTAATDAKFTCDGKDCKLKDLKPGQKIRVFTKPDDKTTAVKIEALDKNREFEKTGG